MSFRLDANDKTIMAASVNDPSVFLKWYLDWSFLPWQARVDVAKQPEITVIGGVGSGKTAGISRSAMRWMAMVPYFKFMNLAPTAWQANLMYQDMLTAMEHHRYQRFLKNSSSKPYPTILLQNGSTAEFMTASDEIERIRGWEGDWIHLDEGGFIDSERTVKFMRTRLRGATVTHRPRIGRLSVTTTATDAEWLWRRYDEAVDDPGMYMSMTVASKENTSLSERDLYLMSRALPEELRRVEMDGCRPDYTGNEFSTGTVEGVTNRQINLWMEDEVSKENPQVRYAETREAGCVRWEGRSRCGRKRVR